MTSDLHYLELTQLARRIHAREISPVEATTAQLARIEKLDPQLKSYAYVMAEAALVQARTAEAEIMRGEIRGPLHGVPIAVKDLCWTQGVPTAAGMTIYRDFRPTEMPPWCASSTGPAPSLDLLLVPAQSLASPTTAQLAHLGEDTEKLNALVRYTPCRST